MKRVVVTGLGLATSIGNSKTEVVDSLTNMKNGFEPYKLFDKEGIPIKLAGTIKGFETDSMDAEDWEAPDDKLSHIKQDVRRGLAPHGFYGIYALEEALQDAGLTKKEISNPRTGMYTASAGSSRFSYDGMKKMHERGVMRCPPLGIVRSVVGTLSYNLTAAYGILGASVGFASACASSGHALGSAYDEIVLGRQDRMIVVAGEDCTPETILPFAVMRVLSPATDPDKAAKPFDKNRTGFVGTGGATVLIFRGRVRCKSKRGRNLLRNVRVGTSYGRVPCGKTSP